MNFNISDSKDEIVFNCNTDYFGNIWIVLLKSKKEVLINAEKNHVECSAAKGIINSKDDEPNLIFKEILKLKLLPFLRAAKDNLNKIRIEGSLTDSDKEHLSWLKTLVTKNPPIQLQ